MKTECCICGDRRNSETNCWYTPTRVERIATHNKHVSHGYCPTCFVTNMKEQGMSNEEIKDMLLTSYNNLTRR